MISFDTNILFYASIEDCAEYDRSKEAVRAALLRPQDCIIADQVYFELYRFLRNPAVLRYPLDAPRAADLVRWYRDRSSSRMVGLLLTLKSIVYVNISRIDP